jgi:hypothetical protein
MDGAYSAPTPVSNACVNEISPYIAKNGAEFALSCGLDYYGSDMAWTHNTSLDNCMEQCAEYWGCVGVAFEASLEHGWDNCYLKSQLSQPTQQAFVMHGAKIVETSSSASSTSTSTSSTGTQTPLGVTPSPSPSQSATSTSQGGSNNGLKLGLAIGIPLGVVLIAAIGVLLFRYRRARGGDGERDYTTAAVAGSRPGAEKVEESLGGGGRYQGFGGTYSGYRENRTVEMGNERGEEHSFGFGSPLESGGVEMGTDRGREELEARENQVYELPSQHRA